MRRREIHYRPEIDCRPEVGSSELRRSSGVAAVEVEIVLQLSAFEERTALAYERFLPLSCWAFW